MAFTIAGCTSTRLLYRLTSQDQWTGIGGTCSGPSGSYERKIAEGVSVRLLPYPGPARPLEGTAIGLSFTVGDGHRVRMSVPSIKVIVGESSEQVEFKSFRSLDQEFPATDDLIGVGRLAKDPRILEKPAGDVFGVRVTVSSTKVESFSVSLPPLVVDGQRVVLADVQFVQGLERFVQCVQ